MTGAMDTASARGRLFGCTSSQVAAITSLENSTIVLAGPGSGKTTVSKHRVAFLLDQLKVSRVGIVTFTRASATDIKARLDAAGVSRERFTAGTFHAHALQQLRDSGRTINAHKDVIHEAAQREYIRLAVADSKWDGPFKAAQAVIDRASASFSPELNDLEQRLLATYRESLRIHRKYDFGDLMRLTVLGMRDGSVRRLPIQHLIVDEAQDIDEVQIEWILCHAEAGIGTTLVADDDQSIYQFRYAQGLQGLRRYSGCVELSRNAWLYLAENFRSHAEIVRCAQKLIRHSKDRVEKDIHAPRGTGGQVDCFNFKNEEEELTRLALTLKTEPGEWAVLARKNKQLDRVELALDQRGIPYWRKPGEGIWETGIGGAVMAMLSSLVATQKITSELMESLILLDAFRADARLPIK